MVLLLFQSVNKTGGKGLRNQPLASENLMVFLKNSTIGRNCNYLPWDSFSTGLQSLLNSIFNPSATWYNHAYDSYVSDLVSGKDVGKLFGVVDIVQFGTPNESNPVLDKLRMEIAVGISGTISRNKEISSIEIGCRDRNQFDLDGPL